MEKIVHRIVAGLEGLPANVPAVSTVKLLRSVDVEAFPRSTVYKAVKAARLEGWFHFGRSWYRPLSWRPRRLRGSEDF